MKNILFSCLLIVPFCALASSYTLNIEPAGIPGVNTTQIEGEFHGCDFDKMYKLTNGMILICQSYGYSYSYYPEVVLLNNGEVIIDDTKYSATLANGQMIETRVKGAFEGCDFDKLVPLANGLIFQCQTYSYTYTYSPGVQIFLMNNATKIFINGKEYKGKILRQ